MTRNRTSSTRARQEPPPKRGIPWAVWIALGGVVLVLAGIAFLVRPDRAAAPAAPQVTGQPKLVVDREQIDFGTVPLDRPVNASFKLTNAGDEPLQIQGQPSIEVVEGC